MDEKFSRRDVLGFSAAVGLGMAAAVKAKPRQKSGTKESPRCRAAKPSSSRSLPKSWPILSPAVGERFNAGVSNGGLIAADDHVMVIDSLGAPLHAKAFLAAIQKAAPNKPIRRVLITHHHGDHIWGRASFPPTEILSHDYCRQAMVPTPILSPTEEKREGWVMGGEPRADNSRRAAFQHKFADFGEYLDSLEMVDQIDRFKPIYLERITPLTNKTPKRSLIPEVDDRAPHLVLERLHPPPSRLHYRFRALIERLILTSALPFCIFGAARISSFPLEVLAGCVLTPRFQ